MDNSFPREEILQAMLSSKGELEEALDHLNSDSLQQFTDHLWERENSSLQGEDEAEGVSEALALSDVHDACLSVTNSVLKHNHFQQMVRNKDISSDVSHAFEKLSGVKIKIFKKLQK